MDKEESSSKNQGETAGQKLENAYTEAYRVKEYQDGINHYMYKKHQDTDLYNRNEDAINDNYNRKVAEAKIEYDKSKR
jgi:hypothetical protein